MKLFYSILLVLLVLMVGCESNRYRKAVSSYYRGNYTVSIEEIDSYLNESTNGAYETNAELIRSKSYQKLALRAYEADNLALATRFAILANSEDIDTLLARCYYDFAQESFAKGEKDKAMAFYDQILVETPTSRFVPEIVYYKMNDLYTRNPELYLTVFDYYKELYPAYKDNYYEIKARGIVKEFIPSLISDALAMDSDEGLQLLLTFVDYTVANTKEVRSAIAEIYINLAEEAIVENEFIEADEAFKMAVFYNPEVKDYVKKRLLETADSYINAGLKYVADRDFENAFILFNRTFDVIPGYKKALQVIQETTILLNQIEQAQGLFEKAQNLEKANLRNLFSDVKAKLTASERNDYEIRRFQRVLSLYQQAYELDPLPKYRDHIFYTKNIIQYYKSPDKFAVEVLKDYKSFIIEKAIIAARDYIYENNSSSSVTDSGWEILVASGNYNYEVRYSLISLNDKLYFRWLVNLRSKEITPINTLSERAMDGKFELTEEEEENED